MAVLVEAICVVVPTAVLARSYPGGLQGFESDAPNSTFTSDGRLASVGFMTPNDVGLFVRRLENVGIRYFNGTNAIDMAVVDQYAGVLEPCDWLEFQRVELFEGTVSVVFQVGEDWTSISVPLGWAYERSMSNPANHKFIPNAELAATKVLRREGGKDVIQMPNGEEAYVGRPFAIVRDVPAEASEAGFVPSEDAPDDDDGEPRAEEPEDDGLDHGDTEWRMCDLGPHWATLATFGTGGPGSEFDEEEMLYAHCIDCSSDVLTLFGATSSVTVQPLGETMKWANLLLDQFKYRDLNTRWFHARLYDNF